MFRIGNSESFVYILWVPHRKNNVVMAMDVGKGC